MTEQQVIVLLLILVRVSTFIALFPLFYRRQLPNMIKVGLAGGLSVFWFDQIDTSLNGLDVELIGFVDSSLLLAREFLIGAVLSLAMGVFFLPAKVAGAYVGQEIGLSLAAINDPSSPDSSTLVTRVFEAFTILIFLALNLHHFLILVVQASFDQIAGKINLLDLPTEQLSRIFTQVMDHGLAVIAPIGILMMLITLGLALLNKAAPTLNLFTVGMPVRTGFGLFCVLALLPIIFGALKNFLYRTQGDIEQLLAIFRFGLLI